MSQTIVKPRCHAIGVSMAFTNGTICQCSNNARYRIGETLLCWTHAQMWHRPASAELTAALARTGLAQPLCPKEQREEWNTIVILDEYEMAQREASVP
jgi:hypothetical protein